MRHRENTFNFSSSCKLVQALRVPRLTHFQRDVHEHLIITSTINLKDFRTVRMSVMTIFWNICRPNSLYKRSSESYRLTSMKSPSGSKARQASRSFLYGDIKLAMQITPASAKSFATSPINGKWDKMSLMQEIV